MKKNNLKRSYEAPVTATMLLRAERPFCASGDYEDASWTDPIIDNIGDIDFIF